jgi:LexA DNA binding domain
MKDGCTPIKLNDSVELLLRSNHGVKRVKRVELIAKLKHAIDAHTTACAADVGAPIWIIGSAVAALSCFTCITGASWSRGGTPQSTSGSLPTMPERSARHAEDEGHPHVTVHGFSMTLAAIPKYTKRQGQYLAFIYYYIKLNGRAPAEADLQRHFLVSAPSVHQMIVTLEREGFISRVPGQSRSIELRLTREQLPDLE